MGREMSPYNTKCRDTFLIHQGLYITSLRLSKTLCPIRHMLPKDGHLESSIEDKSVLCMIPEVTSDHVIAVLTFDS